MIKLFNFKDRDYTTSGIAVIHPLSLMEYKETSLNGWHIEVELPIKYQDLIKEGMVALVDTKSKGPQPFIISNPTTTHVGMHFTANHYVFDAVNYVLEDVRPVNMSAAGALAYINSRTDTKSPFTTNSNVSNVNTAYFVNKTLLEALDTIQERWGGVYDVDKFHINLRNKVGVDRGDTIMYGKNLEGLKVYEDWSNVVTKLLPVGFDGIKLPETYLYSEIDYGKPYTKVVRFETDLEDDERTETTLIEELRQKAIAYLKENEVPKISYEVESNINQELDIGDIIQVKHPVVDIETEVIAYEYNMLTKRTTKLTFGNYKRNVQKKVQEIKDTINEVVDRTNGFETIIQDQTDLINNLNKNGHVYIDDNQILILDKLPKEAAKNVWRWNMGGLGYSENGIEGPFKQAWTIDGVFNTDFISVGSIDTNHLASDVGSALDISSNDAINLLTDSMNDASSSISILEDVITTEIEQRLTNAEGTIENINETVSTVESTQQTFTDRITNLEGEMVEQQTFFRTGIDGVTIGGTDWKTVMHADGEKISFQSQTGNVEAQFGAGGMYVNRWETDFHTIEKFEEGSAKGTIFKNRKGGS